MIEDTSGGVSSWFTRLHTIVPIYCGAILGTDALLTRQGRSAYTLYLYSVLPSGGLDLARLTSFYVQS